MKKVIRGGAPSPDVVDSRFPIHPAQLGGGACLNIPNFLHQARMEVGSRTTPIRQLHCSSGDTLLLKVEMLFQFPGVLVLGLKIS